MIWDSISLIVLFQHRILIGNMVFFSIWPIMLDAPIQFVTPKPLSLVFRGFKKFNMFVRSQSRTIQRRSSKSFKNINLFHYDIIKSSTMFLGNYFSLLSVFERKSKYLHIFFLREKFKILPNYLFLLECQLPKFYSSIFRFQ